MYHTFCTFSVKCIPIYCLIVQSRLILPLGQSQCSTNVFMQMKPTFRQANSSHQRDICHIWMKTHHNNIQKKTWETNTSSYYKEMQESHIITVQLALSYRWNQLKANQQLLSTSRCFTLERKKHQNNKPRTNMKNKYYVHVHMTGHITHQLQYNMCKTAIKNRQNRDFNEKR